MCSRGIADMMPTGSGQLLKTKGYVHEPPVAANAKTRQLRKATQQMARPDRNLVQQAEGLTGCRDPIRSVSKVFLSAIARPATVI